MSGLPAWLNHQDIKFVECVVPDLNGTGKGKVVPLSDLTGREIRIAEAIFGQDVVGAWCEDHDLVDVADVDMLLTPDLETLRVQPWSNGIAQCLCDCETLDGESLSIAPRTVLRGLLAKYEALGLKPIVAQEAEFYLVARNPNPDAPLQAAAGVSGRTPRSPRSFQVEAMSEYAPFMERLYRYCEAQQIELKGTVQEMGEGQLEVNFNHGDALSKADEMFTFKRLVRQAAQSAGYLGTFMAKPMTGSSGSAMHLHQSLVELESGLNIFAGEDSVFSKRFYHYLGGLQKYTPAAMSFLAPNVNSYRRFESADSCPTNVQWGVDNRTTGFRVPKSAPPGTRVENRIPGSDNNPYLAIAVSLACGYLGLMEQLEPSDPVTESAWDLEYTIPRTLRESLDALEKCDPLIELLGERFIGIYLDIKRREIESFSEVVTAWEREHLLLTV
ncbi:MAG: glutamine synthetase [Pseudomonadales bacterium]|nr:glutamine synthetase [Pseudomonadales bacterium]MBO6597164.1 glutamine synthetase [Pseudomonadales bacterium]MBO6823649.1 glutamine synthetase [Pseudomonadales bacterium]